jgi:phage host-nuclease inhibitor protein Gam
MNEIFNEEKVYEIFKSGEVKSLEDLFLIEDVVLNIKNMEKKIDFYKAYKEKKIDDIKKEIGALENKINFLRETILKTLQDKKEKNISFPGTCKVTIRNQPPIWDIVDEEKFIEVLKKENEYNNIVEEMMEYNIRKKEANKLLNDWEKSGKVAQGVSKKNRGPSISITYLEGEDLESNIQNDHIVSKKDVENNYDKLDFS